MASRDSHRRVSAAELVRVRQAASGFLESYLPFAYGRAPARAQRIYANARAGGHTKKEARRILKRHLSEVIYRRMIRDPESQLTDQPLLAA